MGLVTGHDITMISTADLTVALATISLLYLIALAFHRLVSSPLAKFPGPKLAALTLWYEFYYDVIKRGRYTWKIGELHKEYGRRHKLSITTISNSPGPIIRIR